MTFDMSRLFNELSMLSGVLIRIERVGLLVFCARLQQTRNAAIVEGRCRSTTTKLVS